MPPAKNYWRLAVPSPLRRSFDYLPSTESDRVSSPGCRVRVSFGRTSSIAVMLEHADSTPVAHSRLKPAQEVLDEKPLFSAELLALLKWASTYYQYPIGEVVNNALPAILRQGKPAEAKGESCWQLTPEGCEVDLVSLTRAPKQAALLQLLATSESGLLARDIEAVQSNWRAVMRTLQNKGWVSVETRASMSQSDSDVSSEVVSPVLNSDQQVAVDAVTAKLDDFGIFLLDGVTGSGKTEVYLSIIEAVLARGEQALVLVPEIGLTPQLVSRFQKRFTQPIAVLHSGLSDNERLSAWLKAKEGEASIIIGTRSAVFTPLAHPGVIILDEEHDLSFKQQEGFRYSARDVAVKRGQLEKIPVILGSATPSLESLENARLKRYQLLVLPERAGEANHPDVAVIDVRKQPMADGLSSALVNAMSRHLENDGQILLFLNRRGFAPVMLCHDCGWVSKCKRCDAHMTLFFDKGNKRLRCHHCGSERKADSHCPDCTSTELRPVGTGTERLEEALAVQFPDVGIVRIDRDTTRRKGAMQSLLDSVHDGSKRILVGTQMLAKGHHFPDVTLVGIIDIDQGLFSSDFRATERMAQLIVQVSGRAGRAEKAGQVLIQTHHPDHPLLKVLLDECYGSFASRAMDERRLAELPPYQHMALLRAEAVNGDLPIQFLQQAREMAESINTGSSGASGVLLLGPIPAPMEKRAGRIRAQLLLQSPSRAELHNLLTPWLQQLESSKLGRKVRWSIDVDPQEMF
jgi:primosomal protein N' (replication factor Y)